jgi:hypothetical protein
MAVDSSLDARQTPGTLRENRVPLTPRSLPTAGTRPLATGSSWNIYKTTYPQTLTRPSRACCVTRASRLDMYGSLLTTHRAAPSIRGSVFAVLRGLSSPLRNTRSCVRSFLQLFTCRLPLLLGSQQQTYASRYHANRVVLVSSCPRL